MMTISKFQTVLVTGAAGFIGFHLALYFCRAGYRVIGVNHPDMFKQNDIRLLRMAQLRHAGVIFKHGDLTKQNFVKRVFAEYKPDLVFHMAAQPSSRDGNAENFFDSNILAMTNVLAVANQYPPAHFLFASSSSVYGEDAERPFSEEQNLSAPSNPYAKSKYIGEQIAYFQKNVFPITCIRFFNVYGPWGRKDMAPFYFADCLAEDREITIFSGDAGRAWLYIDDAVSACAALAAKVPEDNYRVVNVAGPALVKTTDLLHLIARKMNKEPNCIYSPPDVPEVTSNPACMKRLKSLVGECPRTTINEGIDKFLQWHYEYRSFNYTFPAARVASA